MADSDLAALLHATSNAFVSSFEALTKHNEFTAYFTYEYGIGLAITIPLIAWPFWRLRRVDGWPAQSSLYPHFGRNLPQ